jgi:hypothetical protein
MGWSVVHAGDRLVVTSTPTVRAVLSMSFLAIAVVTAGNGWEMTAVFLGFAAVFGALSRRHRYVFNGPRMTESEAIAMLPMREKPPCDVLRAVVRASALRPHPVCELCLVFDGGRVSSIESLGTGVSSVPSVNRRHHVADEINDYLQRSPPTNIVGTNDATSMSSLPIAVPGVARP